MANIWKNIKKKYRRKKLRVQKARLAKEQELQARGLESADYSTRISRYRQGKNKRAVVIAMALVAVAAAVFLYVEKRTYYSYKVMESSEQEDIVSTKYVAMDGKILRYSPDGVSLVTDKLETLWSENYSMQNPVADVRGKKAVIADRDGTTIKIFDKDGLTGTVNTSYAIIKARISSNGLVAAILDGEDDTWINFYSSDGSLIAENQTKIDDPGYPLDVAISNDGQIMMVAYQFVDGGKTTSYVAFYNFGDVGQSEDDRIVSGYTYEGTVIPEIQYLEGTQSAALRDDGFTLYKGKQIPEEVKTVKVDKEIVSTFYDDETIGLVFKNDSKDALYTMEVYSAAGKLKFKKEFNVPYTSICMSGGYILMYNSSQMSVVDKNGKSRFSGTVDGTISDFFRIGLNRYLLVMDTGIRVIKLA